MLNVKELYFSFLLVVKDEEAYIEQLLDRVLNQDFPYDQYEVIVVDGQSTDGTVDVIRKFMNKYPGRISFFENPQKTLPSGWNIGIRHARGKYVVRVDGHAQIPNDFLLKNYELTLKYPDAQCVGGVLKTKGRGFWGTINAYVYSHPFGVGNSLFRITKKEWEGKTDTVPYGAYKSEVFSKIGLFDEQLKRNEDLEMHARYRRAGYYFVMSSTIQTIYYARNSLSGLIKKSFGDGKWSMIASGRTKSVLRVRQLIPLIAFLMGMGLLVAGLFLPFFWGLLSFLAVLYFTLTFFSSISLMKKRGFKYLFPTMLVFFLLHFTRGVGLVCGLVHPLYWKGKKQYE